MNRRQALAASRFTRNLEAARHDGSLVFSAEPVASDSIMVTANNTDGLRWFETHVFVLAIIGPRGGVRVRKSDGIHNYM